MNSSPHAYKGSDLLARPSLRPGCFPYEITTKSGVESYPVLCMTPEIDLPGVVVGNEKKADSWTYVYTENLGLGDGL